MDKPTQTQVFAGICIGLAAYFSKYEFETIKEEQTRQRSALTALATQSAINGELLTQVLRQQGINTAIRPTK